MKSYCSPFGRTWCFALLIAFSVCAWLNADEQSVAKEAPDFDREIAPILASRCLDCHQGVTKEGNLDLSKLAAVMEGGDSGAALNSSDPLSSLLWQRIEQGEMPPKKHFPEAEKAKIKAWLEAGAKWGTSPIDPYKFTTTSRAGSDWWSLQPLRAPANLDSTKGVSPIDSLVRAELVKAGLNPSPPAERAALLRRLSFDLIGLPPTPEEVQAFVQDKAADAYAKQVKRLLASPHYGERWARHWLDIAHFGESDGFEYDKIRPHAWRYRDWVIDALNKDMPYDEFARQQIAGDVLHPEDPASVTATGFLVAGAHDSLLPAVESMRMIMRQDELEDIVATVGQTFLGMTVHCARCHDHKFDPILQKDYYRLAADLAGVRRGDRPLPLDLVWKPLKAQQEKLQAEVAKIEKPLREKILAARQGASPDAPSSLAGLAPYASWKFSNGTPEPTPVLPLQVQQQTKAEEQGLKFEGETPYAVSIPITKNLTAKTLVAVVKLSNLQQRGSGILTVESVDGQFFDSIVFGEQEPGKWMSGSNNFARTQPIEGATVEEKAKDKAVHIAIVYAVDGTVTIYREGVPYGKSYLSQGPYTFKANEAHVIFGVRHLPPSPGKHLAGQIERAALYDRALTAEEVAAEAGAISDFVSQAELLASASTMEKQSLAKLKSEITSLQEKITAVKETRSFAITPQQPNEPTKLLVRGNPLQGTDVIIPAGLSALKHGGEDFGLPADAPEGDRRVRLANWIVSKENPLFARTMVNRVWQYHFGRGMVDTSSDLGFSGGQPSHPELLDYLSIQFQRSGYSLKQLHEQIVLSQTYQQASLPNPEALAKDADNRLLWRYSPRRLEAESIRDAMLSITGQLNTTVGGISYQDFRPYIYKSAQFFEPQDPVGHEFNRRSVYRMWARGGKNPLLDTFDCPDPSTAAPKRGATTTPLQALSMLNNSFTLRMADDLAKRVTREVGDDVNKQVPHLITLVYGREPTAAESAASIPFVKQHGLAAYARVLLNTNGFLYLP